MGMNGPLPLSKEELNKRGSWRADIVKDHPNPGGCPDCPEWLPWHAKKVWERLIPMLNEMGVLARVDQDALTLYCIIWTKWRDAEEFILKNGQTYTARKYDKEGNLLSEEEKNYPQMSTAHKLADQLTKMEKEFGFTPLSRARMNLQTPTEKTVEKNDKLRLLSGGDS